MNRNEESSITSVPNISRHFIEDYNAPQMIDNTTPIRSNLRARSARKVEGGAGETRSLIASAIH